MNAPVIQDYYGRVLQDSQDLKTSACCTPDDVPVHVKALLANIHDEVLARYYGCGLIAPALLEGARVLDLGCGTGRDVYALAQLVGPDGEVVGVDFTEAQLSVARAHQDWHRDRFGFARSNVRFLEGDIERLERLDLEPGSFDVIVSNCVVNLAGDKRAVLDGALRLLKPGGEFYFSDVYADRRLPDAVRCDPVLLGECLGGALYWHDFLDLAKAAGFADPRLVEDRVLSVDDPELARRLGRARFWSATYRLFKMDGLETLCEDYGQAVIYRGGVSEAPDVFVLDAHHSIERGRASPVCGNTWRMLKDSRFAALFDFVGDFSTHYGVFEGCGSALPFGEASRSAATPCC